MKYGATPSLEENNILFIPEEGVTTLNQHHKLERIFIGNISSITKD
jgi:hypothetical protein